MKNEFIGYYRPTKEEKDVAWKTGVFIFDTNALLNLYRYSKATRDDFMNALEKIKERLYLPYHVALEFHKNRYAVIEDSIAKYDSLIEGIQDVFKKSIENHFNLVKKHPSIDIAPLKRLSDDFLSDIKKELKQQKSDHPDHHTKDDILEKITNLFLDNIGTKFSEKEIEDINLEGKIRYEKKIPPGYKDNGTKSNRNEYGDLIVWKEIIKYAKTKKQPIIFVTDDQKEDWWTIEKGIPIRPREELIKEFLDETGIRILIYNADRFLRAAKRRKLVDSIDSKSLDELQNFSKTTFYGGGDWTKLHDLNNFTEILLKNQFREINPNDYMNLFEKYLHTKYENKKNTDYFKDIDKGTLRMMIKKYNKDNSDDNLDDENLVEL